MTLKHPSGLTCVHREPGLSGLCGQCMADYDEDPSAFVEFGPHPQGQLNWERFLEEMATVAAAERQRDDEMARQDLAAPAPQHDDSEIPF